MTSENTPDICSFPLPPFYLWTLNLLPDLMQLVKDTLGAGRKSPLAVRIMLFPGCAVQTLYSVAQYPGIAMRFGLPMLLASYLETRDMLRDLRAVLGTTKQGKRLFKKWRRILIEANFFLTMGCLRASAGAKHLAEARFPEMDSIFDEGEPSDQWARTMGEWRSARYEARFTKWYRLRRDGLLRKWMNLIDQTDTVWGKHVAAFKGVVEQISGPVAPVPINAIVGRIPATWRQVLHSAEDYLSKTPEEKWPESQNRFAKLVNTNSTTLRKAIEKSPQGCLLQSWDRLRNEWSQNKRRIRSDQTEKPAVISLQDAPEPIWDRRNGEDETEARELLDQHSREELIEILRDVFVQAMRKLGKPSSEVNREWSKLEGECDSRETAARLIVLLRQQYRDMFDTDPKAKIKRRRKP